MLYPRRARAILILALACSLAGACQQKIELSRASSAAFATQSQLWEARKALKQAATADAPMQIASNALVAAEIAWDLDWKKSGQVIKHENRKAAKIYDAAVLHLLSLAKDPGYVSKNKAKEYLVTGPHGNYALTIDPRTFNALADYPKLKTAAEFHGKGGFDRRITREGVGVPLVAINSQPALVSLLGFRDGDKMKPKEGYTAPRTAVLIFDKPVPAGGTRKVKIAIVDPRKVEKDVIGGRELPIAADFTAPLMAAYPNFGGDLWPALLAAINPETWLPASGIYALERYDPERIPVLLVHGLISTPDMWKNLINELNATPGIGNKYLFYVFTYPTGISPVYTSRMLRDEIQKIKAIRPLSKGYVLIGHSMGGILSRMQITDTGLALWNKSFGDKAAAALKHSSPDDDIQRSLIFKADPQCRQAVYICVPHRGSPIATMDPVQFIARIVKAPLSISNTIATSPLRALGILPAKLPSSVDGLSPKSPILLALDPLPPKSPTHSIIGNRGKPGPLKDSSDGVVPYWSSHQQSARSEKIVPAGHGGYTHPEAVAELQRLLLDGTHAANSRFR